MIIPSIDLQDGKAVQLRRGRERVLTEERDPFDLALEFNRYGEVAVIDLDAALGKGDNLELVKKICRATGARAGGGVRTVERGRELLRAGASRIIVGTSAEPEFLRNFPAERVQVAIDHKDGEVVDKGWTRGTGEDFVERAKRLAPHAGGFLCTFVEDEGGMGGFNFAEAERIMKLIDRPLTVAGGVAETDEVVRLSKMGLDVQVGMALYTGRLGLAESVVGSVDFDKAPLVPTVVQDVSGAVLMLAYSSPESLNLALEKGRGIYYSRSRDEIWEKGLTSGNTQELVSCRADCDRDTLLFTVRQTGPACHLGSYSCFGGRRFNVERLLNILESRKREMPEGSYTAKLFEDSKLLASKLLEEAGEVTTAETYDDYVWEIADLVYFASVYAAREGVRWADVEAELGGRHR